MSAENRFADLLQKCGDRAYNFAFRLAGNAVDAQDLVQAAFVKAFERIDQYDAARPFEPWLFQIIKNIFLDHAKSYEKRHGVSLDAASDSGSDETWGAWSEHLSDARQRDPLQALGSEENLMLLEKALASLPPEFKATLMMVDIEGLSYQEVCEIERCPIGTVRSRVHRAREMLRKKLAEHFEPQAEK